ncbi:MAG: FkbM family methyltransferase [Candidatus Asgardarchaeia archaeon]
MISCKKINGSTKSIQENLENGTTTKVVFLCFPFLREDVTPMFYFLASSDDKDMCHICLRDETTNILLIKQAIEFDKSGFQEIRIYIRYLNNIVVKIEDQNNEVIYKEHNGPKQKEYEIITHELYTAPDDPAWLTYELVLFDNSYTGDPCPIEKGDVCLDIGAHYGFFSLLASLREASKIYAVEAVPSTYHYLLKNIGIDSSYGRAIVPFNCAIGDTTEKKPMNVYWASCCATFFSHSDFEPLGTEEISVININEFLEEQNIDHLDYVKINAEGSEYEIFENWDKDFLSTSVRKIAGEYHTRLENHRPEVITDVLESCGFKCRVGRLEPWKSGKFFAWKEN